MTKAPGISVASSIPLPSESTTDVAPTGGISTGAVVGGIAGGLAALAAIVFLIMFMPTKARQHASLQ